MRKILIILILAVVTTISVIAQTNYIPGYIVTLEGDSIKGMVDSRGAIRNANKCSYKKDSDSERTEYLPGEIKAYGFVDGKYYVSKVILFKQDTVTVFLEYLINGIVDVYFFRDMEDNHYYIEKEDMKLTVLDDKDKIVEIEGKKFLKKNNQYIGVLKYVFNESPEIQKKTESLSLNHNNLIKIAKDYHGYVCEGEECIVYEKKKHKVKFGIAPIIGIDFHKLKGDREAMRTIFDTESNFSILPEEFTLKSTNFDYSLGAIGSLTLPSLNENLALNLQVKYGKYKISGEAILASGRMETLIAEGNDLMNNLYFSYTFPKGMFRPVFLAGFSYSIFTNISEINVIEHRLSGEYVLLNEGNANVIKSSYMGLVVGAGLDIPVLKKYSILTTVQYNFMKDTGDISCYLYNPLSIIIGFKL
jgi:hypothetical protein